MLRLLLIGIWTCSVTLASTYGAAYWKAHRAGPAPEAQAEKLEVRKVKPISVPIISEGQLKGYISAEFSYVVVAPEKSHGGGHGGGEAEGAGLDPDSYVMDEAFRRIYADNKLDFRHIEKFDLNAFTHELTRRVNDRLGFALVRETLVKSFAFVPKDDIPH
ncbi:flagellar basal body-associated protein FliL [Methylosinus sp. Sm6]|uniref:flagellar basal body-associated protein FliL n=1 Tax=Methylosinus sp. Sm6 TaxID=2866948 RepID=UPI001C993EF5|nr:flagellar basal body-associated protein FliL [Methylosinus sp. Sm6]MBY6240595.1 flagellar basal body-associated protein FliL [Methylosinus sp. Sm6]